MSTVYVLGRDDVGTVAEDRDPAYKNGPLRYYLTDCCGASAKGLEDCVGCRACYREIDPALGDVPDQRWDGTRFVPKPMALAVVYGDGLAYDDWKARRCHPKPDGGWMCKPAGDLCTHPGGCLLGPEGVNRG